MTHPIPMFLEHYHGKLSLEDNARVSTPHWRLGEWYLCPCCRFPSLTKRASFEVCFLCWWEDDGQDENTAADIRGGPNSEYSLDRARRNFRDHLDMYDKGQGIDVVEKPSQRRLALLTYVRGIIAGSRELELETFLDLMELR